MGILPQRHFSYKSKIQSTDSIAREFACKCESEVREHPVGNLISLGFTANDITQKYRARTGATSGARAAGAVCNIHTSAPRSRILELSVLHGPRRLSIYPLRNAPDAPDPLRQRHVEYSTFRSRIFRVSENRRLGLSFGSRFPMRVFEEEKKISDRLGRRRGSEHHVTRIDRQ